MKKYRITFDPYFKDIFWLFIITLIVTVGGILLGSIVAWVGIIPLLLGILGMIDRIDIEKRK